MRIGDAKAGIDRALAGDPYSASMREAIERAIQAGFEVETLIVIRRPGQGRYDDQRGDHPGDQPGEIVDDQVAGAVLLPEQLGDQR